MRLAINRQPVQRGVYLSGDLRHRGIGRQRVTWQRGGPANRERTRDEIRELILAVALPIPAVNEYQARRIGVRRGEQVPCISLARPVTKIQVPRIRGPECR